jgi:exodeoxyribonuclease V alpha subunit
VVEVNAALQARARQALATLDADPTADWYPGRPVIVRSNDYGLQLFNGDIGLALPDETGQLMVWFAAGSGDAFRAVAPARLPAHDTCLAMTVHQSQGSEFESVDLVLPEAPSPVLTRELVYTGLTRARSAVTLHASRQVLAEAVARPASRRGGLLARLEELELELELERA